jgi:hypothetical protein
VSAPVKGSYWVGRSDGDTYRVDGVLRIPIDEVPYMEERVIFSRLTAPTIARPPELTYTLPVNLWWEFAREP